MIKDEIFPTPNGGVLKVLWDNGLKGNKKKLVCSCSVCSKDKELFPDLFEASYTTLRKGSIPCGCAKSPRYNEKQQVIRVTRKASKFGYKFKGFVNFTGNTSKCILVCPEHGEWSGTTINDFVNREGICPTCAKRNRTNSQRMTPEKHLSDCRSVAKKGIVVKGFMEPWENNKTKIIAHCSKHGEWNTSTINNFKITGCCPKCAKRNPLQCYINSIWDGDIFVGIKFGISTNSCERLKGQNRKNLFQMKKVKVYVFSDATSCKRAERACLKRLQCGIISSRELKDGYSETTSIANLQAIEDIFIEYGGKPIEKLDN